MAIEEFFQELAKIIISGKAGDLEALKSRLAKKHKLSGIPKNALVVAWLEKKNFTENQKKSLVKSLQTKPVRSGSGVSVIAVMAMGNCPGKCIYCPRGENSPQSYTGVEPATMRAKRANYDPKKQIENRLMQLRINGHPTDKCELIIMGGTFPAYSKKKQEKFVKECFDALNGSKSKNLKEAQKLNETSEHRCIGLTIETRPDYCQAKHIKQMLKLGATRVELGVQSLDNNILKLVKRGHQAKHVALATKLLKDSGLKVCYHMMPGLTGLYGKIDMDKEKENFDIIFSNPGFKPDLLKLYPVLVIPGTGLHTLWKAGKYCPLSMEQAKEIIKHVKQIVPEWVRIQRMQRDISWEKIEAGPNTTNLRQLIQNEMGATGIKCKCIRCREVGHQENRLLGRLRLKRTDYDASDGKEIFLSYEDDNCVVIDYLRLRIPSNPFLKELKKSALVRELHVYGQEVCIGLKDSEKWQHKGYGKLLLKEAQQISAMLGMKKIAVTSGIGAREYYKKLGYKLNGFHMVKRLK